ncbi:MAG: DNA methyltransferase [Candidatus Altiarchaeota archaeon]|nr:DNA methyltransferase [Candidatus Altiarchaeota archaeon]
MKQDLFQLSIKGVDDKYRSLLEKTPQYRDWVTFKAAKEEPVYNWFHYKEGFSPQLVWSLLKELDVKKGSSVIDPFCGTGTTLLACRDKSINSMGFDILPLSVFVANTKLQTGYDMQELSEKIRELTSLKFDKKNRRWPELRFFNVKRAYSKYAYSDILFYRDKIMEIDDEKTRNFLFLGLLSIVIGCGNIKKDGGVLKIMKRKHIPPVKVLLRNRLNRMYWDFENKKTGLGADAEAMLGDARGLPVEDNSVHACISSPPYLNWVDYTKVYAIELSLLLDSGGELRRLRKETMRSHLGSRRGERNPPESIRLSEIMDRLWETPDSKKKPEVVLDYFADLSESLKTIHNSLVEGGRAALVISNTCMPSLTIDSDLIMAELSENIGFSIERILVSNVRWCDVGGIKKERPVRESIVVLKK